MNEQELQEYVKNVTFEELKKLRVNSDHISLVDLPEDYGAHTYLTIINSGKPMDRYLGWNEAADKIIKGLNTTFKQKKVTYDFARQLDNAELLKCSEFADSIIENM